MAPILSATAFVAFALGITTPPRSGPYCTSGCIAYPYNDVGQFVPRDYFWIAPASFLIPLFIVVVCCIHACLEASTRHLRLAGLCFASIAAAIIAIDYFIQLQFVEPSLRAGESIGLTLFSQYNPHGLFIALEDLGYLMLGLAFLFIGSAFPRSGRLERAIRWTFLSAGLLDLASFVVMSWHFGLKLEYRFEVAVITIVWTALLVLGILLSIFFKSESQRQIGGSHKGCI
jgi:hypothetical protein